MSLGTTGRKVKRKKNLVNHDFLADYKSFCLFVCFLLSLVIYGVKIKMAPSPWHRAFSGLAEAERVGWLWMWRSHLWLVLSLNPCHSGIFTSPTVRTISVRVNWDILGYLITFPWSTFHLLVANLFTVWDHKPPELRDLLNSAFPSMHCLWQVLNKTCLMNFNFPSQIAYFFFLLLITTVPELQCKCFLFTLKPGPGGWHLEG